MKTIPSLLTLAALAALGLTACGEGAGESGAAPEGEGGVAPAQAAEVEAGAEEGGSNPGVPAALDAAMRCWGLTQGAAMVRIAAPDRAAELPEATTEESGAWLNEAARQAHAVGMTHSAFQALQADYQTSNRLATSARARREAVEPINACLATLPADRSDPPDLAEG